MKREEYIAKLKDVERDLDNGSMSPDEVFNALEEMEAYKPVLTYWHYVKCKAMIKKGDTENIIAVFGDKVSRYCNYEGNAELWQLLIDVYSMQGQEAEAKKQQYMLHKLADSGTCDVEDKSLAAAKKAFIGGDEGIDLLRQLEDCYYIACDTVMAYCVYKYREKMYPKEDKREQENRYMRLANMLFLKEYIEDRGTVIIAGTDYAKEDCDILTYILHQLGLKVYLIADMITEEGDFSLQASVEVSMDNVREYEDCTAITAIEQIRAGVNAGNNIPYIIDYICQNMTDNDFAITLASNDIIEELRRHRYISKRFERLNECEALYVDKVMGFARMGDYCTYMDRIYGCDTRELLNRRAEVDFSIVVPVRNATETFYHTLRTCLEQDYEGAYEIVVSDNSTEGNTNARDIVSRLNDDRIRYYKTPRPLLLTKSFEYSYLQTRGRYIIPIGADDAVLPWALSVLAYVWKNKDSNIITWIRGFYAWPGFNRGQENQFDIPCMFEKNKVSCSNVKSTEYMELIKSNASSMYALPNMYINSGFRREYMKELYAKTGCIIDGTSQDIYMGLSNIAINDDILRIEYPITIAGMSNSSVGTVNNMVNSKGDDSNKRKYTSLLSGVEISGYVHTREALELPIVYTDVSGVYKIITRLMAKGILPSDFYKNDVDIIRVYQNIYKSLALSGDKCEKYIYEGYKTAKDRGRAIAEWFEKSILPNVKELKYYDKKELEAWKNRKTYVEGFNKAGGVVLDASRFGVTNVYEAAQLFKSFLHF